MWTISWAPLYLIKRVPPLLHKTCWKLSYSNVRIQFLNQHCCEGQSLLLTHTNTNMTINSILKKTKKNNHMVPVTQQFLPVIGSWLPARVPASLQRKAPIYSSWVRLGIATRESGAAVLENQERETQIPHSEQPFSRNTRALPWRSPILTETEPHHNRLI